LYSVILYLILYSNLYVKQSPAVTEGSLALNKKIHLPMRWLKIVSLVTVSLQFLFFPFENIQAAETNSLSRGDFPGSSDQLAGYKPLSGPNYPLIHDSYFTDDFGNILMIVNVLGDVNHPGQIVVQEDVDFATILTLAGGLKESANQKKVLVARKHPDKNGAQAYEVDLRQFFAKGDRSSFIIIKPNDTIIIPGKGLTFEKIATIFGFVSTGAAGIYYIKNL